MWKKIQANKIKSWFQTTHNKDIYQWGTHKHRSIKNILPLTWISQQGKINVARAIKGKIQSEAPRYNLKQLHKFQPTKINFPPENKNMYNARCIK